LSGSSPPLAYTRASNLLVPFSDFMDIRHSFFRAHLPVLLLVGWPCLAGWSCRAASDAATRPLMAWQGQTMGTTYNVKVAGATVDKAEHGRVQTAIDEQLHRVNELMSTYLASSELSRFNASPSSEAFQLSPETLEVFAVARRVGMLSGGAFDVTVGPLVNAWGFGPPGKPPQSPSDAELERLKALVGWDRIVLDEGQSTIRKTDPAVYCDLSAVAKGYAVDRVSETLSALGYVEHMVEVGGEVRARGRNAGGQPWRIGVEKPLPGGTVVQRAVPLENLALATSGDYRNYYEEGGRRISHEIDPRTARPIGHHLASVTVISERCVEADAFATALIVLGEEGGYRLAVEQDLAALFLVRDGEGFVEKASPRFEKYFSSAGDKAEPAH
jgi:thiamine biosynthesis lipoprotein